MDYRYFGAAVKRTEEFRLLTGRGDFVDGLNLPGMMHLGVLRSTQAHAKILNVDVERVRNAKATVAVLTADDLGTHNREFPLTHDRIWALAGGDAPALTIKA